MTKSVAIVTGASRGLGLGIALGLLKTGRSVVGVSRRLPDNPTWTHEVSEGNAIHCAGDVSNIYTAQEAFTLADSLGQPDMVVNCAGVGVFGPAGSYGTNEIETVLAGNLIGVIHFCEAAVRRFKQVGGTIVNVMSTAAMVGRQNEAIYCAAKWGAKGYTEALRVESKGTPLRIVGVYPGGMKTRFWEEAKGASVDTSGFMDPNDVAEIVVEATRSRNQSCISDIVINRR